MKAYFEHDKIVHALHSLHNKYVNLQHSTLYDFWKSYVYYIISWQVCVGPRI